MLRHISDFPEHFAAWILAVARAWLGWVVGSVVMAVMGFGQAMEWWKVGPRTYGWVAMSGVLFSVFEAWRKEYVENRDGPNISIEWDSPDSQNSTWDAIRLRNIGKTAALRVEMLDFSWSGLSWHRSVEFESIHPGEPGARAEAQFVSGNHMGYMHSVLLLAPYTEKKPLSVNVKYYDSEGTEFVREFILRPRLKPSTGSQSDVIVEMGRLRVTRP